MSLRLCAEPIRTVLYRPNCLYCGAGASYYKECVFQKCTIACKNVEHQRWAERDAHAWLHRQKMVRRSKYENEPLFQQTDLLTGRIKVVRSSGVTDHDWQVQQPSVDNNVALIYTEGDWHIPALQPERVLQKHITVESLKLSLPEEQHPLVDDLLGKLDRGFYTADAEAHDAAYLEQERMDAISNPPPPPIDPIDTVYRQVLKY